MAGRVTFSIRAALVLAGLAGMSVSMAAGMILLVFPSLLPGYGRLFHVHLAFVGGAVPMIFGAMLYFLPALLRVPVRENAAMRVLFLLSIGAPVVMGVSLLDGSAGGMGIAGIVVMAAGAVTVWHVAAMIRLSVGPLDLNTKFYLGALAFLFAAALAGATIALVPIAPVVLGISPFAFRLIHLHLALAGFVGMTVIGTMHNLLPTVVGRPLAHPWLARRTFEAYVLAIVVLTVSLAGDLAWGRLTAAVLALAAAGSFIVNMARTADGFPWKNPAAVQLMLGSGYFFVWAAGEAGNEIIGIHGKIIPHVLTGITHAGLLGWLVQTVMGAATFLLPVLLLTGGSQHPDLGLMAERMPVMRKILTQGAVYRIGAFNAGIVLLFAGWFGSEDTGVASVLGGALAAAGMGHFLVAAARVAAVSRRGM